MLVSKLRRVRPHCQEEALPLPFPCLKSRNWYHTLSHPSLTVGQLLVLADSGVGNV